MLLWSFLHVPVVVLYGKVYLPPLSLGSLLHVPVVVRYGKVYLPPSSLRSFLHVLVVVPEGELPTSQSDLQSESVLKKPFSTRETTSLFRKVFFLFIFFHFLQ